MERPDWFTNEVIQSLISAVEIGLATNCIIYLCHEAEGRHLIPPAATLRMEGILEAANIRTCGSFKLITKDDKLTTPSMERRLIWLKEQLKHDHIISATELICFYG